MAAIIGGCSYSTDYVVVNASSAPVQVTYTIAPTSIDPFDSTGVGLPAMLPLTELRGREWRKLSQSEFVFDRANSTVTVTLPPNQGLLIYRGGNYRPEPLTAEQFVIDEVRISGANGEVNLTGDALPKAFVVVPQPLFTFGPPTLLMLTYS